MKFLKKKLKKMLTKPAIIGILFKRQKNPRV